MSLQAARSAQPRADPFDLGLAPGQRLGARVDRVVPEHQVVRMLDRGAEDKRRLALCLDVDRSLGFLEYGELAREDRFACEHTTLVRGKPGNTVACGRHVAPALAVLEADMEVVVPRRCADD